MIVYACIECFQCQSTRYYLLLLFSVTVLTHCEGKAEAMRKLQLLTLWALHTNPHILTHPNNFDMLRLTLDDEGSSILLCSIALCCLSNCSQWSWCSTSNKALEALPLVHDWSDFHDTWTAWLQFFFFNWKVFSLTSFYVGINITGMKS